MYQALYRKYRPQEFKEISGQTVIVKTLSNSIKNNTLSHAYLFTGPRGTGKTSIAKILAKTINCENLENLTPCNSCVSCTQINNGTSVDIIEIDAASNNGVDEIRELKSKINLVPANSKKKVYIIDEVHMLTVQAFNALLKTLEEPPSHIIFILATTEPHKIPETILSRCQRFDFKKISTNDLFDRLKYISEEEKINIDDEAIYEIARLSDGGMRDSISMLDKVISYSNDKITITEVHDINGTISPRELKTFISKLFKNEIIDVLELIDKYNEQGKNLVKLTEEIIIFLKNVLLYKKAPEYLKNKVLNYDIYRDLSQEVDEISIFELIDELNNAIQEMKLTNNPKFILDLVILKSSNGDIAVKEVEKPKEHEINEEIKEIFIEIKEVRINNTLSDYKRDEFIKIREKLENICKNNNEYEEEIEIIKNGVLKAASSEYIVYVFENENESDYFNENLLKIEKMVNEVLNKPYKLISTYKDEWEKIRISFNNKEKNFEYIEETFDINDIM